MAMPFKDGMDAYQRGDYATAMRLWRPLADQGNAAAQLYLGIMYEEGWGGPQDYSAALSWYRNAADQGNAAAQLYLGGEPVSDIDTAEVDSLKALDPKRPIREATKMLQCRDCPLCANRRHSTHGLK